MYVFESVRYRLLSEKVVRVPPRDKTRRPGSPYWCYHLPPLVDSRHSNLIVFPLHSLQCKARFLVVNPDRDYVSTYVQYGDRRAAHEQINKG